VRVFEERKKAMIGRTIKTLVASLMLGTMACCCVSLNQPQTRAATLPDKQVSDPGLATAMASVLKQTDGIEKKQGDRLHTVGND
jgi:hypothetical protein